MVQGTWRWPEVRAALVSTMVGVDAAPVRRGGTSRRARYMRLTVTAGYTLWCLVTSFTFPLPGSALLQLSVTLSLATVLPVVLSEVSPLWAWRAVFLLGAVSPSVFPGLYERWGWSWTPSLGAAAILVLYRVSFGYRRDVVGCVLVVTVLLALLLPALDFGHTIGTVVAVTAAVVFGHVVALWRTAEADRVEQQRRRVEQEARTATIAERNAIARELHDVVAHHMSVLALRCDSARYRHSGLSEDMVAEFAALHSVARDGLREMRRLLRVLRSSNAGGYAATGPQPTSGELDAMVQRVRETGVDVSFRQDADLDGLPAGVALSVHRILQEALSNVVRHAPGAAASIRIAEDAGGLRIMVRNEVRSGVETTPGTGHGLVGMRERAVMLGGSLAAGPNGAGDFVVTAMLPVERG